MINQSIQALAGKKVLLLQGPVGPFFARLADDLRGAGAHVTKVNFNAGDWLYFRRGALNYRGTMAEWPKWLEQRLLELRIDVIFLFGDCRPIHQQARTLATRMNVEVWVFEEGYVRPDYVTLERYGVNGYSKLPRISQAYRERLPSVPSRHAVGNTYWAMVRCGCGYFLAGALGKPFFPDYVHHRPLALTEAIPWVRSAWRKLWYRWKERGQETRLITYFSRRFFLAPLQVHNDAQVTVHGDVSGVEAFIAATIHSFAHHAPKDTLLVFKHHPMDRGYRSYSRFIRTCARAAKVRERVVYIHDQHLPTLLTHARGVVVINSTVGLSALHHGRPTIACGTSLYDMPGLTYQGRLDDFWAAANRSAPNATLYRQFRHHLIAKTQLNGSFYRALDVPGAIGGLVWTRPGWSATSPESDLMEELTAPPR
ncbi:MAG: capsule polysaccharide export protein [Ramlibacter sp.]|uniref:capsule biosynthesis protein n=1 Tax=Ramlibacter sp. TaxID=1917967 RepID=UPI00262EE156|nr:capsular biosynthesis protein [Ramlibacter sp.]MDB5750653.1 capsule polysaccharide export protein [Ramlibacter sp.]